MLKTIDYEDSDNNGSSDWNSSLTILYELHNEFKKFKEQTLQKECNITDTVAVIADNYKKVHGYLAIVVCLLGAIANLFIMVVLTRKEMRTPINFMLFVLAIADLLIMIEYIPFALHMYIADQDPELKYSLGWAWFVFFHLHITQIFHGISIQLTLTMAVWRYFVIKCANRNSNLLCNFKRCYQAIFGACVCPLFLCILNYFYFQIVKKTKYITFGPPPFNMIDERDEEKLKIFNNACTFLNVHDCRTRKVDFYVVEASDLAKNYPILHTIHFWIFSVFIKFIPCLVLTFFMCWLIQTLYKARRNHKILKMKTGCRMKIFSTNEEYSQSQFNSFSMNVVNSPIFTFFTPDLEYSANIAPHSEIFLRQELKSDGLDSQHSNVTCHRTDRTSKILIAVLLLFLITEFPQGIMHFLTGWYGIDFLKCNYNPWAEIFDILALFNAALNFILYCFMSQQFRTQFRLAFKFRL